MVPVFDDNFIIGHKLATKYLSNLDALCRRDYKGKDYFHKQIVCLDMDAYESSLSGNNDATMDASVGIADYENNRMANSRHLLVELRFGYKSTGNIDVENMRRKIRHTKDLLVDDRIHERFVFIYEDKIAPQAKSYLKRLARQTKYNDLGYWDAVSVADFDVYVFDKATLPYTPINDIKQIETGLKAKFQKDGYNGLVNLIDYWINEIEKYEQKYNLQECDAIAKTLLEVLDQIPVSSIVFEKDYLDLMRDDVKRYVNA
jgi:hypothetical protein